MKRKIYLCCLFISLIILSFIPLSSQDNIGEMTEGTEFWFGIPHCKMLQVEPVRGEYPISLWISSKKDTKVKITFIESGETKEVYVYSNETSIISITDNYMNVEPEITRNLGIHIESDEIISVTCIISYMWTGEAFKIIPVEYLGDEYVSINLYQDETDEIKPSQILITATEDSSIVQYTPTSSTKNVRKDSTASIILMKGQTFLIESKEQSQLTQDWASDITGTFIKSNKPIAVLSGHTKGCFPKMFVGKRTGWIEIYANFARNLLIEMLLPISMLGTEYVSIPIKYNERIYNEVTVIEDAKGDLIRFVAAYDNTEIYQMRGDGSALKKIGKTLKKGQWHNILESTEPAYYKSNKPVLVAQYGKTWWKDDGMMGPVVETKNDEPQNPHMSGQGMLTLLIPISRWGSYAYFHSPEWIDNFVYFTFKTEDYDKITFDGNLMSDFFGYSEVKQIPGTPYSYLSIFLNAGDHIINSDNGVTFGAYSYGNWDRCKDGFAYGYPLSMRYVITCKDSCYVKDTINRYNVVGEAFAVDLEQDSSCAGIFKISLKNAMSKNYKLSVNSEFIPGNKKAKFELNVIDTTEYGKAVISVVTLSGKTETKTYEFFPECEDSCYILDKIKSGNVTGSVYAVNMQQDSSCAGISSVVFNTNSSENYNFLLESTFEAGDEIANFWLNVIDSMYYAKAIVTATTLHGKVVSKTYEYFPHCYDSCYIESKITSGEVTGTVYAVDLQPDSSCAGIFSVIFHSSSSTNYRFILDNDFVVGDKTADFWLEVIDVTKSAKAEITAISMNGLTDSETYTYTPSDVEENQNSDELVNIECIPNPFNEELLTTISIPNSNIKHTIKASIHTLKGDLVETVIDGEIIGSKYSFNWNGKDSNKKQMASGAYLLKIIIDNKEFTRKLILSR